MNGNSKKMLKTLLVALTFVFAVCGFQGIGGVTAQAASLSLSKRSATLVEGKKMTLSVKNAAKEVGWSSSNDEVVQINSISGTRNQKVVIQAVGAGKANIVAKIGGTKLTAKITVKGITLSKTKASVNEGKTLTLTVKNPTKTVTWTTSNKKIAKIKSKKGKMKQTVVIQGVKSGKVTITAKVGTKKLRAVITVKHVHKYSKATCTKPKTCVCGATKGSALGHKAVSQATCTQASVCGRCYKTITPAYGHNYKAATCTQAQTCTRCSATLGAPLGHTVSASDATCVKDAVCARCQTVVANKTNHVFVAGVCSVCHEIDLAHFISARITNVPTKNIVWVTITNNATSSLQVCTDTTSHGKGILHLGDGTSQEVWLWDNANARYYYTMTYQAGTSGRISFSNEGSGFSTSPSSTIEFDVFFNHVKYHLMVGTTDQQFSYTKIG